jgi:hypothetical protein
MSTARREAASIFMAICPIDLIDFLTKPTVTAFALPQAHPEQIEHFLGPQTMISSFYSKGRGSLW